MEASKLEDPFESGLQRGFSVTKERFAAHPDEGQALAALERLDLIERALSQGDGVTLLALYLAVGKAHFAMLEEDRSFASFKGMGRPIKSPYYELLRLCEASITSLGSIALLEVAQAVRASTRNSTEMDLLNRILAKLCPKGIESVEMLASLSDTEIRTIGESQREID